MKKQLLLLDITATDKGLLIPRVALTDIELSAPVVNPQGGALANGTWYIACLIQKPG